MADLESYINLPLQESWKAVLEPFRTEVTPGSTASPAVPLPQLGKVFDQVIGTLPERDAEILLGRLGQNQTLETLGTSMGLTRERIRQLQVRAQKRLRAQGPRDLLVLMEAVGSGDAVNIDVTSARSQVLPDADGDALWKTLFTVWESIAPGTLDTLPLTRGHWLLGEHGTLSLSGARTLLKGEGRFWKADELALAAQISREALAHTGTLKSDVRLTRGGYVALRGWIGEQWMTAIAFELALAGHATWHFSEMAHALEYVAPDLYADQTGRNVAALLSRTTNTFELAGQKGMWRLRELGDGHRDNLSAVVAVLAASDIPLHMNVIAELIGQQRNIATGSLNALLQREPDFVRLGSGVYGLPGRPLPVNPPEETFMLALFKQHAPDTGVIPATLAHALAANAGIDPERVLATGRFSSRYCYKPKLQAYMETGAALLKHFGNWYEHRMYRTNPPPDDVLRAGLAHAQASGKLRIITELREFFQERDWNFPDETRGSGQVPETHRD